MSRGRKASDTSPMPKPASPWTNQAAATTAAPTSQVRDTGAKGKEGACLERGRPSGEPVSADRAARAGVLEEGDDHVAGLGRHPLPLRVAQPDETIHQPTNTCALTPHGGW